VADINQLSSTDTINAGDLLPLWKTNNGDTRKTSVSTLQDYLQNNLTFPNLIGQAQFVAQYASPIATGFTVTLTSNNSNRWLIPDPAGRVCSWNDRLSGAGEPYRQPGDHCHLDAVRRGADAQRQWRNRSSAPGVS
jgi:hypothetical protein